MERLDDSEKALTRGLISDNFQVKLAVRYAPLTVFAFERLQAHVRSPVYGESPGDSKSLAAARDIAQIGF